MPAFEPVIKPAPKLLRVEEAPVSTIHDSSSILRRQFERKTSWLTYRLKQFMDDGLKWAAAPLLAATMAFNAYGTLIVPSSPLDSLTAPTLSSPSFAMSSQVIDFGPMMNSATNTITLTNLAPYQLSVNVADYFQIPSLATNNTLFDFSLSPQNTGPMNPGQTFSLSAVYTPNIKTNVIGRYLLVGSDNTKAALTVMGLGVVPPDLQGYAYGFDSNQNQVATLPSKMLIQGSGYQPATGGSPDMSVSQSQVLFGNVTVGQKSVVTLLFSDISGSPITINVISKFQTGATNIEYTLSEPQPGSTFAASGNLGSQMIGKLTFAPTTPGSIYGVITLYESSGKTTTVTLLGTGATTNSVILAWTPSGSTGVCYNLYGSYNKGGPFFKRNTLPITATNFTDSTLVLGQTNWYVATAQFTNSDGSPVPRSESIFSNMAEYCATNGTGTSQ